MTREADDKLGKVFSFDTEKSADSAADTAQRDETFTIPAFLRREAKTKEPEPVPLWQDDDFARIAATAESPKAMDDEPTASRPEASGSLKEEVAAPVPLPIVLQEETPLSSAAEARPGPEIEVAAPAVAEISAVEAELVTSQISETQENASPLRVEEPVHFETTADNSPAIAPIEIASAEPVAGVAEAVAESSEPVSPPQAESAEIYIPPAATIPREAVEEKTDPALFARSRIRVEPPERVEQGFERREPRLSSIEPSGEMPMRARASWRGEDFRADVPADDDDYGKWRLGPALDARDIDAFDAPATGDTEWEPEGKASPLRWVLLAIAVAAGGYAVAHQLDTGGGLTASLPFVKAQEQVAAFVPSTTATAPAVPAVVSAPPAPTPAPPAIAPETVSRFVPPAKAAHAAPAAEPDAIQKPEPLKKVARAEESVRPVSEASHEAAAPLTLAPGPRTLSATPAVQTSGEAAATGELVLDVQQRLTRLGYANVPLNGRLDAGTRAAIMSFQRNSGLGMTGLIDPTLLDSLRHTSSVGMRLVKGPDAIVPR